MTVTLYVPGVTVPDVCRVKVEVAGGTGEAGLKLGVTPVGRPEALRATFELNPPNEVRLMVY